MLQSNSANSAFTLKLSQHSQCRVPCIPIHTIARNNTALLVGRCHAQVPAFEVNFLRLSLSFRVSRAETRVFLPLVDQSYIWCVQSVMKTSWPITCYTRKRRGRVHCTRVDLEAECIVHACMDSRMRCGVGRVCAISSGLDVPKVCTGYS